MLLSVRVWVCVHHYLISGGKAVVPGLPSMTAGTSALPVFGMQKLLLSVDNGRSTIEEGATDEQPTVDENVLQYLSIWLRLSRL
jgi:hypothetical protein